MRFVFAYGANWFGLSYLRFPPVQKLYLVFFAYGSPTVAKKEQEFLKGPPPLGVISALSLRLWGADELVPTGFKRPLL